MPSTRDIRPTTKTDDLSRLWSWIANLPAVLFNTCFAILAIVTLCGIVFITKPQGVMHNIPPEMWLPLLLVMAPAQIYAQFLTWSTVFAGIVPTGVAIAQRQAPIPGFLKPVVILLWLCNFLIGFGIVVSLSKPNPGNPPSLAALLIVLFIGSWLTLAANVYLLLAVRTFTSNQDLILRIWSLRAWIGLAMGIVGVIYYAL